MSEDPGEYRPSARPSTVLMLVLCALVGIILARLWMRWL